MQDLLKRIAKDHHITALFVTHDLKEAVKMGDVFGWMQGGSLEVYRDLAGFWEDEGTGLKEEYRFWTTLGIS